MATNPTMRLLVRAEVGHVATVLAVRSGLLDLARPLTDADPEVALRVVDALDEGPRTDEARALLVRLSKRPEPAIEEEAGDTLSTWEDTP